MYKVVTSTVRSALLLAAYLLTVGGGAFVCYLCLGGSYDEKPHQDVQTQHELVVVPGPPFRVRNAWGQDPGWTDVEVRP